MKKNYLFFLIAAFAGMMLSCKSAPPEAEKTPPPKPPVTEEPVQEKPAEGISKDVLNELDDAEARARAARQRAEDFEAPAYFPSEWKEAEAQYAKAGDLPRKTADDARAVTAAFNECAASYDGLFGNALPLYAQAREDEIIAVRDKVIASGFSYYFSGYLKGADAVALEAQKQYENKDYYGARDTAVKALEMYEILNSGASAFQTYREIIARKFEPYDPDNFEKAEEAGTNAISAYDKGDLKSARDSTEEAQLRYNLVLNTGWAMYAAEIGELAGAERQHALDLKGNVAVRDNFNAANDVYQEALALFEAEQFSEAGRLFEESKTLFTEVVRLTEEKRSHAESLIREAEERVETSHETALRAEEIIEGGSL